MARVLAACFAALLFFASAHARAATAFFYGRSVPSELFAQYDRVVVDPDAMAGPPAGSHALAVAYVSLGEVSPSRTWAKDVPPKLVRAQNTAFGSDIIDVSSPEWARFVETRVLEPLWRAGWRAFFFDTLDSWQRLPRGPDYVRGLAQIIQGLKQRHPEAKVLLNRGFELLPLVTVDGLVAESLFESFDQGARRYMSMPAEATSALKKKLDEARVKYNIPVSVIDYVPPASKAKRIETAKRILEAGFDPWVTGPDLDEIGVGRVRIVPRRVLLVYRHADEGYLGIQDACVLVAPVLEHLGYVPEYVDVRKGLPEQNLAGQYAGVVVFVPEGVANEVGFRRWVTRQMDAGLRFAFMHGFGFNPDASFLARLGLAPAAETAKAPMTMPTPPSAMLGFETPARARLLDRPPVRVIATDVKSHVHLEDADKNGWDGVVIGPWGGAAFDPFVLHEGLGAVRRWVLDPFAFIEAALDLPPIPAPDVTTESGRRIWTTHVDGDAFYSRAERRGNPYTAAILLDEVFKKYKVPHTVSVVEGEIGPEGLVMRPPPGKPYPDPTIKTIEQRKAKVAELEGIARKIFDLPNVEIASHTYSHPFFWEDAEAGKTAPHGVEPVHLEIDGYKFSLERDLKGSIDYINAVLAPPGKKVRLLLWSGSCSPSKEAVLLTQKLGVLNVNGGGATRTNELPSLTRGSAMGIPKGDGAYQVFAPVENENVYTNDFLGPYYGYRRAIDTFTLTNAPRRLSILPIYYHFYSAAKTAALIALKDVYEWALKQDTTPLFLSEYASKVLAFQKASIAVRIDDGVWQLGDFGDLRTVRLAHALGYPDMTKSTGVAGVRDVKEGRYVTLARDKSLVELAVSQAAPKVPYVESANGRVLSWSRSGKRTTFEIRSSVVPLAITIANSAGCTLHPKAGTANAARAGHFTLASTTTGEATLDCK
jgi:polysaccharide biosynthesis protein PelA